MKSVRCNMLVVILCTIGLLSCSSNTIGVADHSPEKPQELDSTQPSTVKQSTTRTAHDPVALFPESGVFAFAGLSDLPDDPRAREAELEGQLRHALIREMRSKGYTFGGSNPRLLFSIDLQYHGVASLQSGLHSTSDEYEQVVCIVTVMEPKSGNVIWRGVYRGAVVIAVNEQERQKQVRDGMSRLLEGFPPADGFIVP